MGSERRKFCVRSSNKRKLTNSNLITFYMIGNAYNGWSKPQKWERTCLDLIITKCTGIQIFYLYWDIFFTETHWFSSLSGQDKIWREENEDYSHETKATYNTRDSSIICLQIVPVLKWRKLSQRGRKEREGGEGGLLKDFNFQAGGGGTIREESFIQGGY